MGLSSLKNLEKNCLNIKSKQNQVTEKEKKPTTVLALSMQVVACVLFTSVALIFLT